MQRLKEFQEGMSSDEIEEKLKYVAQVVEVAKEIGKSDTISSLIPFLNDWCPDNDDEALTKLANEIYKLNTVFDPAEMKYVLPLLKHLATTEEVVVRDAAVDSINKIVEDMPPETVRDELVGLIEGLYHDEWFTPRVSSCYLVAKAYQKIATLAESQDVFEPLKTLRECFFGLCKDDTPMVRRAAAKNMSSVFAVCSDDCVSSFVSQFEDFFSSDDEAIKLSLMSFTKDLLLRVKEETDRTTVLTIFKGNMEARSYKIREAAALEIGHTAEILGQEAFCTILLETFLKLYNDSNSEVRNNAIKQMTPLAKILPQEVFTQKVYPFLTSLSSDKTPSITETIAEVVIDLSKICPDLTQPLFTTILDNPTPQVRLLFLQRLDEITLNENTVNRLVLKESLEGPSWRIREEVASHMSYLLKATEGTSQQELLKDIYLQLFVDGVSRVRETCRQSLAKILQDLSADYVFANIIPAITKTYNETNNYLLQFNFLYTYQTVIRTIPSDERVSPMYSTILKEMNNSVPNLRFISCRILTDLANLLPEDVKTQAITKMKELENDSDRDVRYYAALGLKKLVE